MEDKMTGVHLSHCYQGEYKNSCKFGDDFCPARSMTEQIDRPPTKPVPSHSETMSCPHCGEEFGIEDKVEYERTTTRDADAEYYEGKIKELCLDENGNDGRDLCKKCEAAIRVETLKEVGEALEFAGKVARVMNELRSSHIFFVLQQAYGDMDWEEAQGILDTVMEETEQALKEGGKEAE